MGCSDLATSRLGLQVRDQKIGIESVGIVGGHSDEPEVRVDMEDHSLAPENEKTVETTARSAVNERVGVCGVGRRDRCAVVVVSRGRRFRVRRNCTMSNTSRGDKSGFGYIVPKNKGFIVALDSKVKANRETTKRDRTVVRLLSDFLETNFSGEITMELVGSVVILGSTGRSFTALSVYVVSLRANRIRFVGAKTRPDFVGGSNQIRAIYTTSLPIKLLPSVRTRAFTMQIGSNSAVIVIASKIRDHGRKDG